MAKGQADWGLVHLLPQPAQGLGLMYPQGVLKSPPKGIGKRSRQDQAESSPHSTPRGKGQSDQGLGQKVDRTGSPGNFCCLEWAGGTFRQVYFSNALDKALRGRSWGSSSGGKLVFTEHLLSPILTNAHSNLGNRDYFPHFAHGETESLCP